MIERHCILPLCDKATDCQHRHGGNCAYEYVAAKTPPEYRWFGEGEPPKRWKAKDGTIVYRSFADSCD